MKIILFVIFLLGIPIYAHAEAFDDLNLSIEFKTECMISKHGYESWLYENGVLCINGTISSITLYAFEEDMIMLPITTVILNSGGGTFYGSDTVSELMKEIGVTVIVPAGARCMSGCVLLLSSGTTQIVSASARIAVHYVFSFELDNVVIDKTMSEWYFSHIGNTMLYSDYRQFVLSSGIANDHEVIGDDDFSKPRFNEDGIFWPSSSFMYLSPEDLLLYEIINA